MSRKYDVYATPGNTPGFRARRIVFLMAMGFLTVNMVVFAVMFSAYRILLLGGAALAVVFSVIQCLDNRKAMWSWWYVAAWCVLTVLITAALAFTLRAGWYIRILMAEIVAVAIVAVLLLRSVRRKHGK